MLSLFLSSMRGTAHKMALCESRLVCQYGIARDALERSRSSHSHCICHCASSPRHSSLGEVRFVHMAWQADQNKSDSNAKTPRSRPSRRGLLLMRAQTSHHGTPNRHPWSSQAITPAVFLRSVDNLPRRRLGPATVGSPRRCRPQSSGARSTMTLQIILVKYPPALRPAVDFPWAMIVARL